MARQKLKRPNVQVTFYVPKEKVEILKGMGIDYRSKLISFFNRMADGLISIKLGNKTWLEEQTIIDKASEQAYKYVMDKEANKILREAEIKKKQEIIDVEVLHLAMETSGKSLKYIYGGMRNDQQHYTKEMFKIGNNRLNWFEFDDHIKLKFPQDTPQLDASLGSALARWSKGEVIMEDNE